MTPKKFSAGIAALVTQATEAITGIAKIATLASGRKSKMINSKGLTSNAAGRYQQMLKDWPHYRDLLNLPDYGALSQDKVAIQHVRECRALDDVKAGRIVESVAKCRNIWASLTGAGYGQREHKIEDLLTHFIAAGGSLA